jgi:hypothetical protein
MAEQEIEIPKWYNPEFSKIVQLLPQYKGKLESTITVGTHTGDGAEAVKQLGQTEAEDTNTRNGDTPIMTTPRTQRWVYPVKTHWGDLFDAADLLKQMVDPTSPIAINAAIAMGRAKDTRRIIPAFFADARTGIEGADTTVFPNDGSQDINIQVGGNNTDTGMNVAKLIAIWEGFLGNDVDIEIDPVTVVLGAKQAGELFNDVMYVNTQYRSSAVLENGKLTGLMGMNIITSTKLAKSGTTRTCAAYAKSGMYLGKWKDLTTKTGEDSTKQFNQRLYLWQMMGGTRLDEKKVFRVNCKES